MGVTHSLMRMDASHIFIPSARSSAINLNKESTSRNTTNFAGPPAALKRMALASATETVFPSLKNGVPTKILESVKKPNNCNSYGV